MIIYCNSADRNRVLSSDNRARATLKGLIYQYVGLDAGVDTYAVRFGG